MVNFRIKIPSFLIFFLSALFINLLHPKTALAIPEDHTYTGILHHERLDQDQLIQISLIPVTKPGSAPGSSSTAWTAIVTLHFGSFDHPEYIGMHYESAIYSAARQELTLLRNDDGRGRKLPVLRLNWQPGAESVSGTYISMSEHYIGRLDLAKGFDLPVQAQNQSRSKLLQPVSGVYKGYCSASDLSGFKLTSLSLYPSRILMDKTVPESPMNTLNYIGGGLCDYRSSRPPFTDWACESRTGASYNFYTGHLHMWQGATPWDCERTADGELTCNGPRYKQCKLKFIESNALPASASSIAAEDNQGLPWNDRQIPDAPKIEESPPQVSSGLLTTPGPFNNCSDWGGTFHGVLKHRMTGREQPVAIDLLTVATATQSSDDDPDSRGVDLKCTATGSAQLHFGVDDQEQERLVWGFQNTEFYPDAETLTLRSESYSDLVLQFEKSQPGKIEGHWFSGLLGHVGTFTASTAGHPIAPQERGVPGLQGIYFLHEHHSSLFNINTMNIGFDKSSHDPFSQNLIGGWHDRVMTGQDGLNGPVRDSLAGGSYDFYTNYVVMRLNGAFYAGQVHPGYMDLQVTQRKDKSQARPFEWRYRYERKQ